MRGQLMGNRGGRFHDPQTRTLFKTRRWGSKQWISCRTSFKNRHRTVMGVGYTELFFLDEITALAAGHRPCFECRRQAAMKFANCWAEARQLDKRPRVAEMDDILHQQRLDGRVKRCFEAPCSQLPDGTMVIIDAEFYAINNGLLHRWTWRGYRRSIKPPTGMTRVLTPLSVVEVLRAGYQAGHLI